MRESSFVQNNREQWEEIEKGLLGKTDNPEDLRQQFIKVTDDLAYARTFYKNRSIRVYLNSLAQGVQEKLHKMRPRPLERVKSFWLERVPLAMYQSRKLLYLSFTIFFICVGFGILSSYESEEFPRAFFGDDYVNKTLENIESGDPLGVYKSQEPLEMFVAITTNNLRVAFLAFGLGILFSIGSIFILSQNSIMLGTFMYFFYSRGFAYEFNSVVWLHGTFEILAMVVECAAGMVLGHSLIFPGTYTRSQSLFIAGKKGITIMMACVPIIIIAGFIESYITRYTDMPDILQWLIIGLSFVFFVYYFFLFPYLKYRKVPIEIIKDNNVLYKAEEKIQWKEESSLFRNISDTLNFISKEKKKIITFSLLLAFVLFTINYFTKSELMLTKVEYLLFLESENPFVSILNVLSNITDLFLPFSFGYGYTEFPFLKGGVVIIWGAFLFLAVRELVKKEDVYEREGKGSYTMAFLAGALLIITVMLFSFLSNFTLVLAVFFFPLILFPFVQLSMLKGGGFKSYKSVLKYNFFRVMGSYFVALIIVFSLYALVLSPVFIMIFTFIEWFVPPEANNLENMNAILLGIQCIILSFVSMLFLVLTNIQTINLYEFATANKLFSEISTVGQKKKIVHA